MAIVTELELTEILFRHDPMGLAAFGAPADEYESEAETIAPRLAGVACVDDVRRVVHEEFVSWFTEDSAPPLEALTATAEEVWAALSR